ncbi:hypothetical protein [Mycobacterium sp. ZZG]
MARARIQFDDGGLRRNLATFNRDLDRRVGRVMDAESDYATAYLKAHAPWRDNSGAARAGLSATVSDLGRGSYELLLSYSVHYGIFLETKESGKYAVITPAMRIIGQKLLDDLTHIIDRMGH